MSDIAAVGEKRVFEPFDKEAFKKEILNNIKYLFRKTPETASQQEIFQAVAYASKDMIIDEWLNAHKEYEKQDAKTVYYLSMEFLMGRSLKTSLYNLELVEDISKILGEYDINLDKIYEYEPDAGLGNGGLGRLAACYMDGMATDGVRGNGLLHLLRVRHLQAAPGKRLADRAAGQLAARQLRMAGSPAGAFHRCTLRGGFTGILG